MSFPLFTGYSSSIHIAIKLRVKQLTLKPPIYSQHLLYDMEEYTGHLLEAFLSSVATMLPRFKSFGAPIPMLSSNLQKHTDTCSHGVDGLISIHGCPNYIVLMEKNLTWSLWALHHIYPQVQSKMIMRNECNYSRLSPVE
jgi:hypothetical protein